MFIKINGEGVCFPISVEETTRIKNIRAVTKYLMSCSYDIALVFKGQYLHDDRELWNYGITNESTLEMEYKNKT